jgi:CRP-like cAMP-binding protein
MARASTSLDPQQFLTRLGGGKTSRRFSQKHTIFSQGEAAEAVFYVRTGKVKLTVVSQQGKGPSSLFSNGVPFLDRPALPDRPFERRRRLP